MRYHFQKLSLTPTHPHRLSSTLQVILGQLVLITMNGKCITSLMSLLSIQVARLQDVVDTEEEQVMHQWQSEQVMPATSGTFSIPAKIILISTLVIMTIPTDWSINMKITKINKTNNGLIVNKYCVL